MQNIKITINFNPEIVRDALSVERFRTLVVNMLRKVLPTGLVEVTSD